MQAYLWLELFYRFDIMWFTQHVEKYSKYFPVQAVVTVSCDINAHSFLQISYDKTYNMLSLFLNDLYVFV